MGPNRTRINSIASLHKHLQAAIELEHATIPLYLTALYSIQEGSNHEATQLIRSVVMEEMLHMSLAANLLTATGGQPKFNHENFIQKFPGYLRYSDKAYKLRLLKFSKASLKLFMDVERPAKPQAKPEGDEFKTIAQFYLAIEDGLRTLCSTEQHEREVFSGELNKQVGQEQYYGSGGELFGIYNLDDALRAIRVIVDQGEGLPEEIADGDHRYFDQQEEPAHFFKFNQIYCGRYYSSTDTPRSGPTGKKLDVDFDSVHDMAPDPCLSKLPAGSALWEKALGFSSLYCNLLDTLHEAFNGRPEQFAIAISAMYEIKYVAQSLMQIRLPGSAQTCGTSFEYVAPAERI